MVEAEVEKDGDAFTAILYRFCTAIGEAFPGRHDDLMRLRTGHGPANRATIRQAARNLTQANADKASLKVRRKTLAWNDDYLEAALHPDI